MHNGRPYAVYFCNVCKTGSTIPAPSGDELSEIYSSGSYRTDAGRRFNPLIEFFVYVSRIMRRRRVEKYVKTGSILDVGCGRGLFLDVMRRGGWKVAGSEFNKETASFAAVAYGIPVAAGNPSEWGFPAESFDAITMSHVLEHLRRPAEMIGECRRLLRNGGLLAVAVPDISSLQAAFGKEAWFHLDLPCHLHHFSEDGLTGLLQRHSFRIMKIRRFDLEYNPFGWLQTLLNRSGIRRNALYDLLKSSGLRKKAISEAAAKDIALALALLPVYLPLSLALSLYESFILKKGGTVEVFAVRE